MSDAALIDRRTFSRVPTLARRYDVSEWTIWKLVRNGHLKAHRPTKGITLIDNDDADRFFAGEAA